MAWHQASDEQVLQGCMTSQGHKEITYVNGLVQDCSDSSALAMELLQSCTKPLIC